MATAGVDVVVGLGDAVQRVTGADGGCGGEVAGGLALGFGGEVVAAEQPQGDVVEQQRPEGDLALPPEATGPSATPATGATTASQAPERITYTVTVN